MPHSPPPGWTLDGDTFVREWRFAAYPEAAAFVMRLALLAEGLDHHPDVHWRYTQLTVRLSSHDVGGLSKRDVRYAEAVNAF